MHPDFFTLFGYPVSSYGVLLSLAHLAGITAVLWLARRRGMPLAPVVDLLLLLFFSGLIGGRIWYMAEYPEQFTGPKDWFHPGIGGFSAFGGMLGTMGAFVGFTRRKKLPLWETADLFTPALPLSLGIVRLGCFLAGCCYGTPTELPWAVTPHSPLTPPHLHGLPLHPTQIYEALFLFLSAGLLFLLQGRKWIRGGSLVSGFFLAYAAYRLATNPLRADLPLAFGGWTVSDLGAVSLFLVSAGLFAWRAFRADRNHP